MLQESLHIIKRFYSTNHFQVFQLLPHQLINLLSNFLVNFNSKMQKFNKTFSRQTTTFQKSFPRGGGGWYLTHVWV